MTASERSKEATEMKAYRYFALALGTACAAAACGPRAKVATSDVGGVRGEAVEMWVESGGERLDVYRADDRAYLLGEPDAAYEIVVLNRSGARVEVVLSVDGRDAVSGAEADFRANRGYVLDPGELTRVQGFRTSLEAVAAFEFARADEAYAARMGTPANVGVIGLAVFDEAPAPPEETPPKLAQPPQPAPYGADEAAAAPASKAAVAGSAGEAEPAQQGLGTRYGRGVDSEATVVPFARLDPEKPIEVLALYYDDREGLEARGIRVPPPAAPEPDHRCTGPNPFPGVPCAESGFAPPPP
jgi:hypothetical protein